jgi:hypothetical protein
MYSLNTKQYLELNKAVGLETAIQQQTGDYLITIEVFHQLHCLNYLRHRVYETPDDKYNLLETNQSRTKHLSHCIDYLRQVLMCHGDLTPITLYPEATRNPPYMPDFAIKHTCRNWDSIYAFAKMGDRSGLMVE